MYVEASWWAGLGSELGACGVVGLGTASEDITAWTIVMRRRMRAPSTLPHAWKLMSALMLKWSFPWFVVLQQSLDFPPQNSVVNLVGAPWCGHFHDVRRFVFWVFVFLN